MSDSESAPVSVGAVIERHLSECGMTIVALADRSGLARSHLARIMREHTSPTHTHDLGRIAWAFASEYESMENPPSRRRANSEEGKGRLYDLLNELMEAAGYSAARANRETSSIRSLLAEREPDKTSRPKIRIGWTRTPFIFNKPDSGLLSQITTDACRLLGADPDWRGPSSWPDLEYQLHRGNIDCIAPTFLRTPFRQMRGVSFSDPIPHISIPANFVVPCAARERIGGRSQLPFSSLKLVRPETLSICTIAGDLGDTFDAAFSAAPPGFVEQLSIASKEYGVSDAARHLIDSYNDSNTNRVPCLVADQLTCIDLVRRHAEKLCLLLDPHSVSRLRFRFAFAVDPGNSPLLSLLNESLRLLSDNAIFRNAIQDNFAEMEGWGVSIDGFDKDIDNAINSAARDRQSNVR